MEKNASIKDFKVKGTVLDEKGRSVSGAEINLDDRETRTLFDGSFLFEELSPGSYLLRLKLNGYEEHKQVVLIDNDDVEVELMIEPEVGTGKIMGYVLDDDNGLPPSNGGTVLMILPTKNRFVGINPEDGYYEFSNLASGFYTIMTSFLEYEEEKIDFELAEGEEKRVDFSIKIEEVKEVPWG